MIDLIAQKQQLQTIRDALKEAGEALHIDHLR